MSEPTIQNPPPTEPQPLSVTFKKRITKSQKAVRKRRTPSPASQSDDSSSPSSDDSDHVKIKRRKKNQDLVAASSTTAKPADKDLFATVFAADANGSITSTNDATKQSNWFDEDAKGAPAKSIGPVKAPTNVRYTTVTDFAPDVCKDYKQTGFCGFGDSCKFLHAREDYKQGWQLDREWENVTKGKKYIGGTVVASADKSKAQDPDDNEEEILKNIPFACIICKESYKNPIVTRCGHYFCEACALKRYRKDPSCAACGVGTNGVFNTAKQLKKLLEKKREREAAAGVEEDDSG